MTKRKFVCLTNACMLLVSSLVVREALAEYQPIQNPTAVPLEYGPYLPKNFIDAAPDKYTNQAVKLYADGEYGVRKTLEDVKKDPELRKQYAGFTDYKTVVGDVQRRTFTREYICADYTDKRLSCGFELETVFNVKSKAAILDFQHYNIHPAERVSYVSNIQGASVFNRIYGGEPSKLLGSLTTRGVDVYFVNQAGFVFGDKFNYNGRGGSLNFLDLDVDFNALVNEKKLVISQALQGKESVSLELKNWSTSATGRAQAFDGKTGADIASELPLFQYVTWDEDNSRFQLLRSVDGANGFTKRVVSINRVEAVCVSPSDPNTSLGCYSNPEETRVYQYGVLQKERQETRLVFTKDSQLGKTLDASRNRIAWIGASSPLVLSAPGGQPLTTPADDTVAANNLTGFQITQSAQDNATGAALDFRTEGLALDGDDSPTGQAINAYFANPNPPVENLPNPTDNGLDSVPAVDSKVDQATTDQGTAEQGEVTKPTPAQNKPAISFKDGVPVLEQGNTAYFGVGSEQEGVSYKVVAVNKEVKLATSSFVDMVAAVNNIQDQTAFTFSADGTISIGEPTGAATTARQAATVTQPKTRKVVRRVSRQAIQAAKVVATTKVAPQPKPVKAAKPLPSKSSASAVASNKPAATQANQSNAETPVSTADNKAASTESRSQESRAQESSAQNSSQTANQSATQSAKQTADNSADNSATKAEQTLAAKADAGNDLSSSTALAEQAPAHKDQVNQANQANQALAGAAQVGNVGDAIASLASSDAAAAATFQAEEALNFKTAENTTPQERAAIAASVVDSFTAYTAIKPVSAEGNDVREKQIPSVVGDLRSRVAKMRKLKATTKAPAPAVEAEPEKTSTK